MDNLISRIESLLFISGRPMSVRELSELLKAEASQVEEAGDKLLEMKKTDVSGLAIVKSGNSFQMVTSPVNAALIQEFVKDETTGELSRPSLETLTIIAYRGPVSKTDLDRIRGVNCGMILHNLTVRGLIDAREDKKTGDSYYTVTFDFLKFLGLSRLEDLPDYERLHKDDTIDRILSEEDNVGSGQLATVEVVAYQSSPLNDVIAENMTEEQKEAVFEEALSEIASSDDDSDDEEDEVKDDDEYEEVEDEEDEDVDDEDEGDEDEGDEVNEFENDKK